MNLQRLDMNLVVALDALLRHQSVTRAAEELELSQPAMSQALARLREALGDPILTRVGNGLVPTPAAKAMRAPVAAALASLDDALFPGERFDPRQADAIITIGVSAYYHEVLIPRLVHALQSRAARLQVHAVPLDIDALEGDLRGGRFDLAIGPGHLALPEADREVVASDTYRCVVRREHPSVQRRITLQQCGALGQVLLSPGGPWASELAHALRAEGMTPRYVLVTDHLTVALEALSRTDYYAVLPRRVAEQFRADRLRVLSPPIELGTCSDALYWYAHRGDDPLHRWIRELVAELARNLHVRRRLD